MNRLRIPNPAPWLVAASVLFASACSDDDDGGSPPPQPTPEELLATGKSQATQGNLQAALADFEQAAADSDSTPDQVAEAQLYVALLDLGLAFDAEGTGEDALAFHNLMARFGLPPEGPDVLAPGDYFAQFPDTLPSDSPTQAELRTYVVDHLVPGLQQAQSALAALPPTVHSTLTTQDGAAVELDATDVLAARTLLAFAEFQAQFAGAYGGNVDLDSTVEDGRVDPNAELLADPDFLTLQEPSRLVAAQDALRRTTELYGQALASLQAETDDQSDDLVVFGGSTPEEVMQSETQAAELGAELDQVHAAIVAPPGTIPLDNGYPLLLDLGATFTELDLRDELPQFNDDFVHSGLATLMEPVLHGVFPGLSALQADKALHLLASLPGGHAVQVLPGAIAIDDGTTSDWGIVPPATSDPTGVADFTTDPDDGTRAVDITTVFLAQVNTHTPSTDHYYFRLDFVGGEPNQDDNRYAFTLMPNLVGSSAPGFEGEIVGDGGDFELTVRRADTGDVVVGPDATLVGGGASFLEFGFTKQFLVDAGVTSGTEYALVIESRYTDPSTQETRFDHTLPLRYSIDL